MRLLAALAASLIGACASLPTGVAPSECRQRFEQADAEIAKAGVRDGGEHRVEGFPYLRVNRFLASFRDEKLFTAWVEQLRRLDLQARRAELKNLGAASELASLDRCGRELVRRELETPEARAALREAAQVPDDYSTPARVAGLYPLAVPFLGIGIEGYQSEVRKNYAKPLAQVMAPPRIEYRAAGGAAPAQVQAFAPAFSVATLSDSDRIGTPLLHGGFDVRQPVVYFQRVSTRFGGRVLPQLVYTAWFAKRPARGALDPYSGNLDAIVWRVTLDEHNRPLAYDTIHACGCYHLWFPVQPLEVRTDLTENGDPPLLPQHGLAPKNPVLVVDGDTHFVSRVISQSASRAQKNTKRVTYSLRSYEELRTLDDGKNGTRSLFDANGIVAGSERGERWWLWMSGISSPGAMRQWGRHATAFIGRRHFDDARILESVFVP